MEQLDTISILAGCGYSGSGTNNGIAHFNQPYGMAVLADGTIVVSDSRVGEYSSGIFCNKYVEQYASIYMSQSRSVQ